MPQIDGGNRSRLTIYVGLICLAVRDVDDLSGFDKPGKIAPRIGAHLRFAQEIISEPRGCILHGGNHEGLAIEEQHMSEFRFADARRVRQHCLENGLELSGRARNDAQHFGGRRLLLQRLAQIVCALAQLLEQAGIFDGNDSLTGKALNQLDLLFGKGANLLPVNADDADQFVFPKHRHGDECANPREIGKGSNGWIAFQIWLGHSQIVGVHHVLCFDDTTETAAGVGMNRGVASPREVCGRDIVHRDISEPPTLVKFECAEFCLAKPNRILQHRPEYRLKLTRRTRDDAQHLGGCRLLLQ
jgi:hypothetical protein